MSPSGAIERCDTETADDYVYLVDGGTIDSSAAAPAALLLEQVTRQVRAWNDARPATAPCIQPIVVQIDNGYEDVVASSAGGRPPEILVPIQGGLSAVTANADTARQELAINASQLRQRAGCDNTPSLPTYLQLFPQSHPGTEAPLGWSLSPDSRSDMREQLATDANQCSLMALRYWMTRSPGDGICLAGTVQAPTSGGATEDQMAASGVPVSLCWTTDGRARTRTVRTNAYGVFVAALPLPTSNESLAGLVCDEDVAALADATGHGVQGVIEVGIGFEGAGGLDRTTAGWSIIGLGVAGVLLALVFYALVRTTGRSNRRFEWAG